MAIARFKVCSHTWLMDPGGTMSVQGRSEILLSQCHPQPDGRAGRRRHRTDCRGPLLCGFVVRPSGSGGQRQEREDCVHPWCSSHRGGPERLGPCLSGYSGHRSTRGFSAFIIVHPPPPRPFITTDTPGGCSCVSCIVALGIKRNRLCTRLGEEQLCLQGTLVVRTGPCLGGAAGMLA